MAGWSGGRKVIAPGVAHAETVTTFHSAPLHGASQLHQLRAGGKSAARGAAGDHGDDRRSPRRQQRHRRRAPRRLPQLRRGRGEPRRGGPLCRKLRHRSRGRAVQDRADQRRRPSARCDLLSDRQGHGRPAGNFWRRAAISSLRRHAPKVWARLTTPMPSAAWWRRGRSISSTRSAARPMPRSTNGRPRCSSAPCGPARCTSLPRASRPEDRALTGVRMTESLAGSVAEKPLPGTTTGGVAVIPEGPYVVARPPPGCVDPVTSPHRQACPPLGERRIQEYVSHHAARLGRLTARRTLWLGKADCCVLTSPPAPARKRRSTWSGRRPIWAAGALPPSTWRRRWTRRRIRSRLRTS